MEAKIRQPIFFLLLVYRSLIVSNFLAILGTYSSCLHGLDINYFWIKFKCTHLSHKQKWGEWFEYMLRIYQRLKFFSCISHCEKCFLFFLVHDNIVMFEPDFWCTYAIIVESWVTIVNCLSLWSRCFREHKCLYYRTAHTSTTSWASQVLSSQSSITYLLSSCRRPAFMGFMQILKLNNLELK